MPSEKYLLKKAKQILEVEGWVVWRVSRVKFQSNDSFNIGDFAVAQGSEIRLIQITTASNFSTRKKKVMEFMTKNCLSFKVEIWAWDDRSKEFKFWQN